MSGAESTESRAGARVGLVPRRDALALVCLAALVLLALLWAVAGEIRVGVNGTGILLDSAVLASRVGPIGALDAPDLVLRRAQIQARIAELDARDGAAEPLRLAELTSARDALTRRLSEADARIAALEDLAARRRGASEALLRARRTHLEEELQRAQVLADSRDADARLAEASSLSRADIAAAREAALAAARDAHAAAQALAALPIEQVDATADGDALAARLAEARADRDQVVAGQLALERGEVERQSALRRERRALADELAAVDEALTRGRVGGQGEAQPSGELVAAVFLDAADAKRVAPGAEIRVAPDSVERARFGSVVGTVLQVSDRPLPLAQAEALLANLALAERLAGDGRAMLVIAGLSTSDATESGLQWTTSQGPPGRLSAGTTLTASITVERRRPITWFIPALRSLSGTDS